MNSPYNAPHQARGTGASNAPHAALLIDFDNVTMGIRSDLSKELKNLLGSDIIKGKVAVQRAYADWRRYPQYIVPLSEASVDLIFAPAYGSSKKNATDIRLAIDAAELVFTRPEIGVYILLSGDSDFSSLVLKLKEYGKYVIGVGIKESSSDLLVQNCDEYYSYNVLTGLTKAGDEKEGGAPAAHDPWELVEKAVNRMVEQNDVMRSDRLKQVMLELDPTFDEKAIGYSKYNKFLSDAAGRNRLKLRKLENGQFEVAPPGRSRSRSSGGDDGARRSSGARSDSGSRSDTGSAAPATQNMTLDDAYALLKRAVRDLADRPGAPVRDSDVKRRMLEIRGDWDESVVGFAKFSHFLRQAHNSEVIDLQRTSEGFYEVVVQPEGGADAGAIEAKESSPRDNGRDDRSRESSGNGRSRGRRGGRDRSSRSDSSAETESASASREEPKAEAKSEPKAESKPEPKAESKPEPRAESKPEPRAESKPEPKAEAKPEPKAEAKPEPKAESKPEPKREPEADAAQGGATRKGVGRGFRGGSRRGSDAGPPPLLEGQTVSLGGSGSKPAAEKPAASKPAESAPAAEAPASEPRATSSSGNANVEEPQAPAAQPSVSLPSSADAVDAKALGLPTDAGSVQRYLTNRYRGVGDKTAEAMIDAFGADKVFAALQAAPDRVNEVLGGGKRASALIEAWQQDYARRAGESDAGGDDDRGGAGD